MSFWEVFVYKQEKLFSYVSSDVGTVRWVEPDDVSLSVGLGVGVVICGWLVLDLLVESTGFKCFVVVRGCTVENFLRGGYFADSFPDVLWELFDYARWVVGVSVDGCLVFGTVYMRLR